jgi:hypothetical protein
VRLGNGGSVPRPEFVNPLASTFCTFSTFSAIFGLDRDFGQVPTNLICSLLFTFFSLPRLEIWERGRAIRDGGWKPCSIWLGNVVCQPWFGIGRLKFVPDFTQRSQRWEGEGFGLRGRKARRLARDHAQTRQEPSGLSVAQSVGERLFRPPVPPVHALRATVIGAPLYQKSLSMSPSLSA